MKFGVNYTPRVGWFHHWVDFDAAEVARDFDTIAELGVDHVRVFPLWPIFQPNATFVSPTALGHLETVIDLAAERDLQVAVDGLQGHLSSFDFLPAWLATWHRRNMFTDPDVIAATSMFLETLARVAGAHENVFALTVGNEVNQFSGGVHPDPFPATPTQTDAWLDATLGALRRGAPDLQIMHACYDASWYENTQPFTLEQVARRGDVTVTHSWVFNGTAQRFGPDAFETRAHARYLIEVARAFQTDPQRPIWAQELGAPRNVLPSSSIRPFIDETIGQLADAPDLTGITWWCSHDVSRALGEYPPLEYDLGLIDENGAIKDEGRWVAEAVAVARDTTPRTDRPVLELRYDELGGRSALAPEGSFFADYMELARTAGHPRIDLVRDPNSSVW
ncbi:glycoside hydrolase 5 family protein [Microbacterium gorillae]|uniref:glycoside hydrolase 5 family protein n=1 Tax=Microbacterium gorillae TaxID=1231063 RepID=UPI000694E6FA|nr:hypothetical protein [Microbacterium gorillae]